jgi:hypothetical protein
MQKIVSMGKFTAIGMRTKVEDKTALVINTCGQNDTAEIGTDTAWVFCNPTNRALVHRYEDVGAVSVEALWQGCKLLPDQTTPDVAILHGEWRKNKGKRPVGAYAGPNNPLITTPGEARRKIYVPAFRKLIEFYLNIEEVRQRIDAARKHDGPVYLRDHDTGRGIDRNGPMSHAWLFAMWLNTGVWPGGE